jgi:hypothetical protein
MSLCLSRRFPAPCRPPRRGVSALSQARTGSRFPSLPSLAVGARYVIAGQHLEHGQTAWGGWPGLWACYKASTAALMLYLSICRHLAAPQTDPPHELPPRNQRLARLSVYLSDLSGFAWFAQMGRGHGTAVTLSRNYIHRSMTRRTRNRVQRDPHDVGSPTPSLPYGLLAHGEFSLA